MATTSITECEVIVLHITRTGAISYCTDGMWGKVKADVRMAWNRFPYTEFRAAFAQMCKDRGAKMESVSRALRHMTSRTTELYYARIRAEYAFRELENAFSNFTEK